MGRRACRCTRKRRRCFGRVTQKEFTREKVKKCVAKLTNRKAEGADQIVNEVISTREKERLP